MSEQTTQILNSLRTSAAFGEWLQALDPRGARGTAAIGLAIAIMQLSEMKYTRHGGNALPTRVCEHVIIADPSAGKTWVLERIAAAVAALRAEGHPIEVIESRAQSGQALDDQLAQVWCEPVAATASGEGEKKAAAATVYRQREQLPAVLILLDEEGAATAAQSRNGAIDPYTDRRQVALNELCSGVWHPTSSRSHKEKYPTIHGVRVAVIKTAQPKNAPYLLTPGTAQGAERRRLYWTLETSASMPTRTGDPDADVLAEARWRQERDLCISDAYLAPRVNEQVKHIFARAQMYKDCKGVDMPPIRLAEQAALFSAGAGTLDGLECRRAVYRAAGSCQLYRSVVDGGEDVADKQVEHIALIMAALRMVSEPEAVGPSAVTAADFELACDVIALSREVYERYAAPDLTSSSAEVRFVEQLNQTFAVAGTDKKCNRALESELKTAIGRDQQRQRWFLDYAERGLKRVRVKDKYPQFVRLSPSEQEARKQLLDKLDPAAWRAAALLVAQQAQPAPVPQTQADRCSAALAALEDYQCGTDDKNKAIFAYLKELSTPDKPGVR